MDGMESDDNNFDDEDESSYHSIEMNSGQEDNFPTTNA